MAAIGKLKDRARKHEQKEDWQSAIVAYQEVLEKEEESEDLEVELSLYNRIGDLHLRLGQTDQAVSYYETAADKYAESGFFNNAIALCNKALRHDPDRPAIYLKLSGLCAEQGFQTDARRWILEYSERQMKAGRAEEALSGLENFADLSDDAEIREALAQQLVAHDRPDEALEQLRHAYVLRARNGEAEAAAATLEHARQIDPSAEFHVEPEAPAATGGRGDAPGAADADDEPAGDAGLAGLETRRDDPVEAEPVEFGLDGLETTAAGSVDPEEAEPEPGALSGLEVSYSEQEPVAATEEDEAASLGDLETFDAGAPVEEETAEPDDELAEDEGEPEPLPLLDTGYDEFDEDGEDDQDAFESDEPLEEEFDTEPEPLPLLDTGFEDEAEEDEPAGEPAMADASDASTDPSSYAMDLDLGSFDLGMGFHDESSDEDEAETDVDVETVLQRGRDLVSRGLVNEALLELRVLSGRESDMEVVHEALAIVNEIVREETNHIEALQRRVEYSALTGERDLLVTAYLDLADALARLGAETKAQAMYERVLALEPESQAARDALGSPVEEEEETIDLDAVLREMEPEEIAERAQRAERTGSGTESDPSFAAMLSQFKAKVSDRPDHSDNAGDHYDLGLAFKEMGLIDEAIAEFQTALTGGTERLKVYEELGQCFIQKNQFNVALKVLTRALQVPHADDSELLGVYYHLGQCHEELGQRAEAREAYQKVLAQDAGFQDVPERMARL